MSQCALAVLACLGTSSREARVLFIAGLWMKLAVIGQNMIRRASFDLGMCVMYACQREIFSSPVFEFVWGRIPSRQ